jgi:hypothetical protein
MKTDEFDLNQEIFIQTHNRKLLIRFLNLTNICLIHIKESILSKSNSKKSKKLKNMNQPFVQIVFHLH